jgi:8-oxo-dGTP diphosphatase
MNEKHIQTKVPGMVEVFTKQVNSLIPHLSVDCVIFGFHGTELKVLLSKFHGSTAWALPGGFIHQQEDVDAAAHRTLLDHTGLKGIYLQQFHVFGQTDRMGKGVNLKNLKRLFPDPKAQAFLLNRFVSVGYYALVDFGKVNPTPSAFYETTDWFHVTELPVLVFDHGIMIQKALDTLRHSLDYQIVGYNLMPECFTMKELQTLYETILGQEFLRANFQRKMLEMNILERLEKRITGKAHKSPYLYRFKQDALNAI